MGALISTEDGATGTSIRHSNGTTLDKGGLWLDNSTQTQGENYTNYPKLETTTNINDLAQQPTELNYTTYKVNRTLLEDEESYGNFRLNLFGTYVYPTRWLTLPTLYSWLAPLSSLAMIIGCVIPYVPQYRTIYTKRSSSGFSTFVCLTLLIANILRIAFWFGHRFELPLLIQSILMIIAQILLLEICVRIRRQSSLVVKRRGLFTSHLKFFWRWTDIFSYLEFLCIVTALLSVAMYFFIDCKPFVETLGYISLVTESMLGLPQVLKNYRNKSVVGMSLSMVIMWLGGDMFKTGYFIANDVPLQFWLCGLLQITVDLLILFQVCLFRQNAPIKMNSRADNSPKEMLAM